MKKVAFMILLLTALVSTVPAGAAPGVDDVVEPDTVGTYAYNVWGPDVPPFIAKGATYVDPKLGSTVRRLTNDYPSESFSDIYAKNGFWNADNTRMLHRTPDNRRVIIDTTTGNEVRTAPGDEHGSFAPDNADTWYWFSGSTLKRYSLASDTSSDVFTFSGTIGSVGGSLDWIDRSGRYMVLNIGGTVKVFDSQTLTLYAGGMAANFGEGWVTISPDGNYLVKAIQTGTLHQKWSYPIDHVTHTVQSAQAKMIWDRCGDHGDVVSLTDNTTWFVTFDCDSDNGVWAVDVSRAWNDPDTATRKLFSLDPLGDHGHISRVSQGVFQNWAYVSVESQTGLDDPFGEPTDPLSSWRPLKQEIVMVNVLTNEVRRLAHHRSRQLDAGESEYRRQPRVNSSWDGRRVAWASNFNAHAPGVATGYVDIYAIRTQMIPKFTSPPIPPAVISGTVPVDMSVTGSRAASQTFTLKVDSVVIWTHTETRTGSDAGTPGAVTATYSWDTTSVSNGTHTLVVTVTDSDGLTPASSQRTVSVSNP